MKSQTIVPFPYEKPESKKSFFRSLLSRWKRKKESLDIANCECYILIKCAKPSSSGDMKVEMTYEGDINLAGYLVENASQFFAEKSTESELNEAY